MHDTWFCVLVFYHLNYNFDSSIYITLFQRIKAYVTGNSENPLVIHGFSGCGKTSIMSMAAKLTKSMWKKQAVVLCR